MYISIENYQFDIRVGSTTSSISIDQKEGDKYILSVPSNMPDVELRQFLKLNAKKLIRNYERNNVSTQPVELKIYNQIYFYKQAKNTAVVYKKGNLIIGSAKVNSQKSIQKISNEVVLADIKLLVSNWEENLNFLVETIYLKNYKTKSFHICPKSKAIGFSTRLKDQQFSYVKFVVAKAVFAYLAIEPSLQEDLLQKYVEDWKRSSKIFDYERTCRDTDFY